MVRVLPRSANALLPVILLISTLAAACGGAPPVATTTEPAIAASTATAAPPPTPTPEPTVTPAQEPTSTPEATAVPELGQMNDENQWWDGVGWQTLPEGEGFQLSVAEDGTVTVMDANGVEYAWDNGQWVEMVLEAALGSTRVNPDTQITEVYVGNNIYLEAPAHYRPEYVTTTEAGAVYYDAPGLHLYVNESGEWQVRPFEEVPMNGFEVMYGAGGEYTITSDTAKAEERKREFFVSWVQAEANADYRQEILGTITPSDDEVWSFLQENGLPITESFKLPHDDTYVQYLPLIRFAGDLTGRTVDVNAIGISAVLESEWRNNKYGIQAAVSEMTKISGRYITNENPITMYYDRSGRIQLIVVNNGVPDSSRELFAEETYFGGYSGEPLVSDPKVVTQIFETLVNHFQMWSSANKNYWVTSYRITPEEYHRLSGRQTKVDGSYGAYLDEIEAIYGQSYLIENVR